LIQAPLGLSIVQARACRMPSLCSTATPCKDCSAPSPSSSSTAMAPVVEPALVAAVPVCDPAAAGSSGCSGGYEASAASSSACSPATVLVATSTQKDSQKTCQREVEDCASTSDEEPHRCSEREEDEDEEDESVSPAERTRDESEEITEKLNNYSSSTKGRGASTESTSPTEQHDADEGGCRDSDVARLTQETRSSGTDEAIESVANAELRPEGFSVVAAIANVISHLASLGNSSETTTCFHARCAPRIGIQEYLDRVAKYFYCSEACLVLGLVYIDRIMKLHKEFMVSSLNVHRLVVTSVMLAAKFHDDVFYSNEYYARVGGLKCVELGKLEVKLLRLLNWRLHVRREEYDQYFVRVLLAQAPPRNDDVENTNR